MKWTHNGDAETAPIYVSPPKLLKECQQALQNKLSGEFHHDPNLSDKTSKLYETQTEIRRRKSLE